MSQNISEESGSSKSVCPRFPQERSMPAEDELTTYDTYQGTIQDKCEADRIDYKISIIKIMQEIKKDIETILYLRKY